MLLGSTKIFTPPLVSRTAVDIHSEDLIVALHSTREITQMDKDARTTQMIRVEGNLLHVQLKGYLS